MNDAEVTAITPDGEVDRTGGDAATSIASPPARCSRTSRRTSSRACSARPPPDQPEGAQVKVNLLLKRLPRLRDAGLDAGGRVRRDLPRERGLGARSTRRTTRRPRAASPTPLPVEIYCHSLTDPSILSPELRAGGAQTLTVFGLHAPDRLVTEADNDARRAELAGGRVRARWTPCSPSRSPTCC